MHREVPFYWKPDPQGHFMFWESKTRPVPLPQEEQFVEIPLQVAHLYSQAEHVTLLVKVSNVPKLQGHVLLVSVLPL
jgi:hypothetical protein